MTRTAVLLALLLVCVGCRTNVTSHRMLVGPISGAPSPTAFRRLLQTARTLGYEPTGVDLVLGVFRVPSRSTPQGTHELHVQCFADGHVQVTPEGPLVRRRGTAFLVPRGLRDEQLAFARGLGAGGGVARRPP